MDRHGQSSACAALSRGGNARLGERGVAGKAGARAMIDAQLSRGPILTHSADGPQNLAKDLRYHSQPWEIGAAKCQSKFANDQADSGVIPIWRDDA
jgi:hypothetical protein